MSCEPPDACRKASLERCRPAKCRPLHAWHMRQHSDRNLGKEVDDHGPLACLG